MPRTPREIGYRSIANARELFEQSVARKKPDFRFVALAIGQNPLHPPDWAIAACIDEKKRTERIPSAGNSSETDLILNELVRFYYREYEVWKIGEAAAEFVRTPFRKAVRHVCTNLGVRLREIENSDDNWFLDVRRSWDDEQKNAKVLTPDEFAGFKMTHRALDVIIALLGRELGMPSDPVVDLWRASILRQRD